MQNYGSRNQLAGILYLMLCFFAVIKMDLL